MDMVVSTVLVVSSQLQITENAFALLTPTSTDMVAVLGIIMCRGMSKLQVFAVQKC